MKPVLVAILFVLAVAGTLSVMRNRSVDFRPLELSDAH